MLNAPWLCIVSLTRLTTLFHFGYYGDLRTVEEPVFYSLWSSLVLILVSLHVEM